jgi:hypothetical protein
MDSSSLFQSKQTENGCLQPSTQHYGVTMQKMCADSIVMSPAHSLFVHVLKIERKTSFGDSNTWCV